MIPFEQFAERKYEGGNSDTDDEVIQHFSDLCVIYLLKFKKLKSALMLFMSVATTSQPHIWEKSS